MALVAPAERAAEGFREVIRREKVQTPFRDAWKLVPLVVGFGRIFGNDLIG
jgi:hypothetical protein